jgi:hypothetical protein
MPYFIIALDKQEDGFFVSRNVEKYEVWALSLKHLSWSS